MDDYLHMLWSSRHGHTKKRTASSIAASLKTVASVGEFVEDISKYTTSYLTVVSPDINMGLNAALRQDIQDLHHLNVQAYGFLTMVHFHAINRLAEAVSLTLSLQIRNITVTNHDRPNAYEKDWPRWAMLARKGDVDTAFREIRDNIGKVSDKVFEEHFKAIRIMSPPTSKYLLRKLDPISIRSSGAIVHEVDLEHILPKSISAKLLKKIDFTSKPGKRVANWIGDLGEHLPSTDQDKITLGHDIEVVLHMLGNQALLHKTPNRKGKDDRFDKKKQLYSSQVWELTKSLADAPEWKSSTIKTRQAALAKEAIRVWNK